ncbi:MAG: ABC transporter ATP-binding protein [Asgard group archaeon]|nr:ABC transporter ATP-binding protein [Asgard group archaeon]
MEPLIQVKNVDKIFGNYFSRSRVTSLRNINFEINKGERVCLFGPNGAGKSTIMKALIGLVHLTSGTVVVNGLDVSIYPRKIKSLIGYLPSDFNFFLETPCGESLLHFGLLRGLSISKAKAEVSKLLELIGLTKWSDLPPKMMSSGMKQRLSLAMAIIGDPEIILFDEPVSFIDVQGKMKIYQMVQDYVRDSNKTIIMSTHNIQDALIMSDRLILIDRGQIIMDGPIADVVTKRCSFMEIILSEEKPNISEIKTILGEGDFELSGRKIFIRDENALQNSINVINKLLEHKIGVFSYRPYVEQKKEKQPLSNKNKESKE